MPGKYTPARATTESLPRLRLGLKLASFVVGLAILFAGAWTQEYPDWDMGVSIAMALATLATAEWSVGVVWQRRWAWLLLAAFWTWLAVDGVYWAYWSMVRPEVMIREGQWLASLCLYLLCGIIWYRLVPLLAAWITTGRGGGARGES